MNSKQLVQFVEVTSKEMFTQTVIGSKTPVLAYFWSRECVPCKQVLPVLERIGFKYKDKLKIVKVLVDENMDITSMFSVMGLPTILFFEAGKVQDQLTGFVSEEKILSVLSKRQWV